jgi:hypothetical protein
MLKKKAKTFDKCFPTELNTIHGVLLVKVPCFSRYTVVINSRTWKSTDAPWYPQLSLVTA